MDLFLVRHAIAEPRSAGHAVEDARRPLTPDGVRLFSKAARGLRALGVQVDGVLASPYTRAWSTAEILHAEAEWPAPVRWPQLEPEVPPSACLGSLQNRSESSLALVGHQPQLSRLASLIASGDPDGVAIELKKGGVICLRTGHTAPGEGLLGWSASPRMLRLLAR